MKKTDSFPKTRIQALGVDPISLSRALLFQGTIRKPKHRRNVFMAGTEYFGETAQLREHIPEFYLSTLCGNHTAQSHTLAVLIR